MARPIRTKTERERDRALLAKLYFQGWLQADIAEKIGVSRQQIGYDLGVLRKRWQASALIDFNAAKARELARVDNLEREYWETWERSKEQKESTLTKRVDAGAKRNEAQVRRESQIGDPRFLTGVQWCIERRCKILGVDAPTKVEHQGAIILGVTYGDDGTEDKVAETAPDAGGDPRE